MTLSQLSHTAKTAVKRIVDVATVDAFQRDGAVLLKGLFSHGPWIDQLREAVDANRKDPGPLHKIRTPEGNPGELFIDFQLWQRHSGAKDFVFASPAAETIAKLLGTDRVWYYHDHLVVKEPGTREPTPLHHDQPYYPVDGEMVASLWLPLDTVPEEIAVNWVAGSHRWGREFAPVFFDPAATALDTSGKSKSRFEPLPENMEAEICRGSHKVLKWATEPGDVIAFHGKTLHFAPGNPMPSEDSSAPRRRRAWSTRWFGSDARYADRPEGVLVSPNLIGHGLQPGDPMGRSPLFPLAWESA